MKTLKDVREKYTQKQRIMRDMGRNRGFIWYDESKDSQRC